MLLQLIIVVIVLCCAPLITHAKESGRRTDSPMAGRVKRSHARVPPGVIQDDEETLFFSEGLAAAEKDGRWGFKNRKGQFVIKPQFDAAGNFNEGLARVRVGNYWGYIDKSGKFVISPRFYHYSRETGGAVMADSGQYGPSDFSDGLARVKVWFYAKVGYIDKTGRMVIKPMFDEGGDFAEGLARVKVGGQWGFIDKTGRLVIKPQFDDMIIHVILDIPYYLLTPESFSEGLARVKVGEKWGFINKRGEFQIGLRFDAAQPFSEGLAAVKVGKRWGFINRAGRFVIRPKVLDFASTFQEGEAFVILNEDYVGYMNRRGRIINIEPNNIPLGGVEDDNESGLRERMSYLKLDSEPQGAVVYLIPLSDLDQHPEILQNATLLESYRVPDGNTPIKPLVYRKTYVVIFEVSGAKNQLRVTVRRGADNKACFNKSCP